MTTQVEIIHPKTKFDPSKIWKGKPTPIKKEAKQLIVSYLEEVKEDGEFENKVIQDLGVTFEYAFRLLRNPEAPIPTPREALMSIEAQEWAGLDRRDPCVDHARFNRGVLAGGLHTWSTILNYYSPKEARLIAIDLIKDMPEIKD